jgi:hypothetical protein
MLLVNSTHSSRAFAQRILSGSNWQISQPFTPYVPPFSFGNPVFTWVSGDTITGYVLRSVNLASVYGTNATVVYDLTDTFPVPTFSNNDTLIQETSFTNIYSSSISLSTGNTISTGYVYTTSQLTEFLGGYLELSSQVGAVAGYNAILTGTSYVNNFSSYHTTYLDTGAVLNAAGNSYSINVPTVGAASIFGPGTLNIIGGTLFWVPVDGAILSPIEMLGNTHGYSMVTDAGVTSIYGGITLNQTNYTAAAGPSGFGQSAWAAGVGITSGLQP